MQTLFVWTLVHARFSRLLKVLIQLPLFIVESDFVVALIPRVVSGAGLVLDTLNNSVERSLVLLQVPFFIAYLFEGPRAQMSFLMAIVVRLIRLFAWATSAILIKLRLYDEVYLLFELHSLYHVLLIQPGLFTELSISLGVSWDDTWLPERLRNWTTFVFDNLCKHFVDSFDSGHALHLHVEVELFRYHLVQGLHVLTVLTHKFLNNLATRLVVNLFRRMRIASMVNAINVRWLMHNKWGYNRSWPFLVLRNVAHISSGLVRWNLQWLGVPKCTTLKVAWASSGLAICCNRPVEIENPNLSSILSEPRIRLVRIKVTSCFRLTGALIADR